MWSAISVLKIRFLNYSIHHQWNETSFDINTIYEDKGFTVQNRVHGSPVSEPAGVLFQNEDSQACSLTVFGDGI